MSKNNLFSCTWAIGNPRAREANVEDQNFTRKAHFMKSKERPWVLTKEGSIHEARRINIKVLCMLRFPAKRPLKNLAKSSERTGPGYPKARDPRDV